MRVRRGCRTSCVCRAVLENSVLYRKLVYGNRLQLINRIFFCTVIKCFSVLRYCGIVHTAGNVYRSKFYALRPKIFGKINKTCSGKAVGLRHCKRKGVQRYRASVAAALRVPGQALKLKWCSGGCGYEPAFRAFLRRLPFKACAAQIALSSCIQYVSNKSVSCIYRRKRSLNSCKFLRINLYCFFALTV